MFIFTYQGYRNLFQNMSFVMAVAVHSENRPAMIFTADQVKWFLIRQFFLLHTLSLARRHHSGRTHTHCTT